MAPKRIGMSLFDDELKALINASAKIFPITQEMVDTNSNPEGYEYGKIERRIYKWFDGHWDYIVADDIDIKWTDVSDKPSVFPPDSHGHVEFHSHGNKTLLDGLTQMLIDGWNSAVTHISDAVKHITSAERTLWNTVSGKADVVHEHDYAEPIHAHDDLYFTEGEVTDLLFGKSDTTHNHSALYSALSHDHDGRYYTESEVNTLLGGKANLSHTHTEANITDLDKYTQAQVNTLLNGKSDTDHGHTDLHAHTNKALLDKVIASDPQEDYDLSQLQYIEDIRLGYTEGHTHTNLTLLQSLTQNLVDAWNGAVTHISDAVVHITSGERTLWNTVSSKADTVHTHPYADDVHTHLKADITDLSLEWLDITGKPLTFPPDAHLHDDRYYTEGEIDTKLTAKADSTTLSGHTGNTTVHVTQLNKDTWDGKADALHNHTLASLTEKSYNSLTDKPTIPSAYTHPSTHPASMITDLPTSLPANGGNADTVDGVHASGFATSAQGTLATNALARSGGTMTGILYPQNNTSYTTGQARRIVLSTGNPSGGGNGDVWIKYT